MDRPYGRHAAFALLTALATAPATGMDISEVLVTGSRLSQRGDLQSGPLVSITAEGLEREGITSLGQALQRLPMNTGSPANAGFNAAMEDRGGDGSTRIDLRGLGPGRTLVLLDGRRFVNGGSGGDSAVDLNMIPMSMVRRIEVLDVGASAIYGADAVGGVVNVITRRPQDGADLRAALQQASRGDGRGAMGSIVAGSTGRSGSVLAGLEWAGQSAVWMDERAFSRQRETLWQDGSVAAIGLAQTPEGYFRVPLFNALGLAVGTYTRVSGSSSPATADDFRRFVEPEDRYNPNQDEYLTTPFDRLSGWITGQRALGERTTLRLEAIAHRRTSEQVLRPPLIDTRFGIGIPRVSTRVPGIPSTNYYNPFRVDMLDVRRRVVEAGRRRFLQEVRMVRFLAALESHPSDGWSWQAAVTASRSDTDQTTSGEILADRLELALGPSGPDGSGRVVCGQPDPGTGRVPATAVIPGCVPLNVFGGQGPSRAGTIDASQLAFVSGAFKDEGRNGQFQADLVARGTLSGPGSRLIDWAAGAEFRRESGYRRPDPAKLAGVSGSVAGNMATGGSYRASELYAELRLPLDAATATTARVVTDLGARWSDFSSFGNASSLSGRLSWRPVDSVSLRASYSEVFRVPTLESLYQSRTEFFSTSRDPCGNRPDETQRAHCLAAGVPGGSYVQPPFEEIFTTRSGSTGLAPEQGRSWAAGITWRPGAASASLDYWDVRVNSAIRQFRDQTILDSCAETGDATLCRLITRQPDGWVARVDSPYLNIGSERVRGMDLAASLDVTAGRGRLSASLLATRLLERSIQIAVSAPPVDVAGTKYERALYPRWRGMASVEYASGRWGVGYSAEYIGQADECSAPPPVLPGVMTGCRSIEAVTYHDVRASYTVNSGVAVSLLLTNLLDTDPPRVAFGLGEGNTSTVTYRLLGRTMSLQMVYRSR